MTGIRDQFMAESLIRREQFSLLVESGNLPGHQSGIELAAIRILRQRQLGFRVEDEIYNILKEVRSE